MNISYSYNSIELLHEKMTDMLIDIYAPGCKKEPYRPRQGNHDYYRITNGIFTIDSQADRNECVVKSGKNKLFEMYLVPGDPDQFRICTRGMYLKHLNLDDDLLEKIESTLEYNERFDMKHFFFLSKEDTITVCECYKNIDDGIDNHLVKPGQIENSSKR